MDKATTNERHPTGLESKSTEELFRLQSELFRESEELEFHEAAVSLELYRRGIAPYYVERPPVDPWRAAGKAAQDYGHDVQQATLESVQGEAVFAPSEPPEVVQARVRLMCAEARLMESKAIQTEVNLANQWESASPAGRLAVAKAVNDEPMTDETQLKFRIMAAKTRIKEAEAKIAEAKWQAQAEAIRLSRAAS